jgi:chromosome segregation ATPase
MVEATDIEKKSLEAHVELCAERYSALETRLDDIDERITGLSRVVNEVRDMVIKMSEKRSEQLIGWGLAIIGALTATTGYLLVHYVLK